MKGCLDVISNPLPGNHEWLAALRASHALSLVGRTDFEFLAAGTIKPHSRRIGFLIEMISFPNPLGHFLHLRQQISRFVGFRHIAVSANTLGQIARILQIDGRHNQDRNRIVGVLESLADLVATLAGQDQVQNDEVRLLHDERRLSLPPFFGDSNLQPLPFENRSQYLGRIDIVLDDQHQIDWNLN